MWKAIRSLGEYSKLLVAFSFVGLVWASATAADVQPGLYSLDEAVEQGVVDINFNPWAKRSISPLLSHIAEVHPGLINRLGFLYGGQSATFLKSAGNLVQKIRIVLPKSLIGGGFNEAIYDSYKATLPCGGSLGTQTFIAAELASKSKLGPKASLVDMSKTRVQEFYRCVGQILVDSGITYLHFEAPALVLHASSSLPGAIEGYRQIQSDLRSYGASYGIQVYFSGDPELAKSIKLDGVYMPSRFYHTTIPQYVRYQNRIPEPGVGVGYTYALSKNIIKDTVAQIPQGTKVFFYVDNWDEKQDDLRRVMELDQINRQKLFEVSAVTAAQNGSYFILPLVLCEGCILKEHVGDKCEIVDGVSEYDAFACGDLAVIRQALDSERGH